MKNMVNVAEKLRQKLENTPYNIKRDFIQKYVEDTYHIRDCLFDMIDVITVLKNELNTGKEKDECDLFIKKMQAFLEVYDVLVEEYIRQNDPSTAAKSEPTNSALRKNYH